MGEVREFQLQILGQEPKESNRNEATEDPNEEEHTISKKSKLKRWLRIFVYSLFLLAGQTGAAGMGRLYYDYGGKSNWLVTTLQFIGFPILIPFYLLAPKDPADDAPPPPAAKLAVVYISLGLLLAADGLLFSLGLMYLPLSTYALLTSTQLAFNAVFSFFLNAEKITSFVLNCLVLLAISSVLLVFDNGDSSETSQTNKSKSKFAVGFLCAIGASAGYGLLLSLTEFAFRKVIKKETFKAVMDMIVYQSLVASLGILIGLFASGDWERMEQEKNEFKHGKVVYAMILLWTSILWQISSIGSMGLIIEVSSLFSNAISVLGVPLGPILATVVYHEKMTGVKGMAMLLAVWGLSSYVYQQYLDDFHGKAENQSEEARQSSEASSSERLLTN